MLKARIIPCLDVADGRVVKGVNFVSLRDAGDPVEAARAYDAAGADELCFLDIHATHENRGTMMDVVNDEVDLRAAFASIRWVRSCLCPPFCGGTLAESTEALDQSSKSSRCKCSSKT